MKISLNLAAILVGLQSLIVHQVAGTKKGDQIEQQYGDTIDAILANPKGQQAHAFAGAVLKAAVPDLEAQVNKAVETEVNKALAAHGIDPAAIQPVEVEIIGALDQVIEQGAADLEKRLGVDPSPAPAAAPPTAGGSPE